MTRLRSSAARFPWLPFGALGAALAYGYYRRSYRYRDPLRRLPATTGVGLLAPVDGRVEQLSKTSDGWQITLKLSPLSVRYIYAPQDGKVAALGLTGGANLMIGFENGICVILHNIHEVSHSQQTLKARTYVAVGETVQRGNKLAFLEGGNRVSLCLSLNEQPSVGIGEWVIGGQTQMAKEKITVV